MAIPQNAVEQLSRHQENVRTPGWFGELLFFSTVIFFLSLGIYFGMRFGYEVYLTNQNTDLQKRIDKFSLEVSPAEQEQLIGFYSQLQNLNVLLDKHIHTSQLYAWLEGNTVSNVYYSKLAINTVTSQMVLSGYSRDLASFSQQLQRFQDQKDAVSRVTFNNVSLGQKGYWQFDVTLFFLPSFFASQAQDQSAVPPSQTLPLAPLPSSTINPSSTTQRP
jgi:hypothetical protein